jgi:hypothetical protein
MRTCPVCVVKHDPEIHEATLSVRAWLRSQLRFVLDTPEPGAAAPPANGETAAA